MQIEKSKHGIQRKNRTKKEWNNKKQTNKCLKRSWECSMLMEYAFLFKWIKGDKWYTSTIQQSNKQNKFKDKK